MSEETKNNIVLLPPPPEPKKDCDVTQALAHAAGSDLQDVVITGYDNDGEIFFAVSDMDTEEVYWLLARIQRRLLQMADQLDNEREVK